MENGPGQALDSTNEPLATFVDYLYTNEIG